MLPAGKMDELAVRRMETLGLPRLQLSMGMATYTIMTPPDDPSNPETACNSVVNTSGAAFAGTGHSLQVWADRLLNKRPLCIDTDRKFWALGFVAMCQERPKCPQQNRRVASPWSQDHSLTRVRSKVGLVERNIRRLDHGSPCLEFAFDESLGFGGRAADRFERGTGDQLLRLVALQVAVGDRVDLLHDFGRRAGPRHDRKPRCRLERLIDLFRDGGTSGASPNR